MTIDQASQRLLLFWGGVARRLYQSSGQNLTQVKVALWCRYVVDKTPLEVATPRLWLRGEEFGSTLAHRFVAPYQAQEVSPRAAKTLKML
ncbi:MAG: hypothetical protein IPI14_01450 [Polaromonas sp.]|nr:hypothetical protein [Polaromonas sp.]